MRIALAVTLAVLVLADAAGAQERLCRGQFAPPPNQIELEDQRELDGWINARKGFGFRHDAAYVRRLAERGRFTFYDFPATLREIEYLDLRNRLKLNRSGYRYLEEHRSVYGSSSVEDGWPREPYLLFRFTRDVKRHLAALKRHSPNPRNLRAKRVRYSTQALERMRERVDSEELEAAGFHVQATYLDEDRGVVVAEIATQRTDAQAYFRQRYKGRVKPVVHAATPTALGCATAVSFAYPPDGHTVAVTYRSGGGATFERVEVVEAGDRVEVGIVEESPTGAVTADLRFETATIKLAAPLGDRALIDAATGLRIRQRGPTPGDPPCPRSEPPAEDYVPGEEELFLADLDVDNYLRRHADVYGGVTVEGGEKPYLVFGFTKDRARHARALKRLSQLRPNQIRTRTVEHTHAELVLAARRIAADAVLGGGFLDGYGRAGFFYMDVRIELDAVIVGLVTTRPDHATWLRARYGPAVRTEVMGERFECAAPLE